MIYVYIYIFYIMHICISYENELAGIVLWKITRNILYNATDIFLDYSMTVYFWNRCNILDI